MSDNIPFEIQMEIIKKVSNVKSLIQFRSVSKPWKSFIDSPEFIKGFGARHTQPHSRILSYKVDGKYKYISLVGETFKVQQQELALVSPLLKQYHVSFVVGACHGLLCLFCWDVSFKKKIVVIWNPSIQKSFGIAVVTTPPNYDIDFGFGVCPVTRDPTIVKILRTHNKPWHVEVFTLSSGVWNVIPSGNLPRQTIRLDDSTQVVIDKFIYWGAYEYTFTDDGESTTNHMVVSFDLITKKFTVVDLPDSLTNELFLPVKVSKLRGSLVVYTSIYVDGGQCCGVWVREHDSSFRKLFTIGALVYKIMGFKKNGETIFETQNEKEFGPSTTLDVYDPCSQQIKNLGISGIKDSFFMGSYKESLLLLNHFDSILYCDNN